MRTFARRQNQSRQPVSTSPARSHIATPGTDHREHPILHLQRALGNHAVQRLLQIHAEEPETRSPAVPIHPPAAGAIQTTLAVDKPGDEYEREADRVAEQVMRMPEPRFGHDFSRVRVHSDAVAGQSARDVNARADTVGHDIVFGAGWSAPRTHEGRRLPAHELTQVVQQSGGPAAIQRAPATDTRWKLDENAARYRGQLMAKRIRNHSKLSKEARAKINSELAYFEGAAKEAYLKEVRPALLSVIEIEMPAEQVAPPAKAAPAPAPKAQAEVEVEDPRNSPRYIDKLFQGAGFAPINGLSTLRWTENGKAIEVFVPLARLWQNDAVTAVPILELHSTREEADKTVLDWTAAEWVARGHAPSAPFYSFYRTPEGVIMPTLFSKDSAPEFHEMWPALAKPDEKTMEALADFGNAVNPIPGTKVDVQGNVNISGDPLDWLALLHLRRTRIGERAKVKGLDTGRTVTRTRMAIGIDYHITGMVEDFDAIKGTSVYVLKDAGGNVLYVGEGDVFNRLRSHFADVANTQEALWGPSISQLEVHATDLSKVEALALEEDLVQALKPLFNKDQMPFEKLHPGESRVGRLPKGQKVRTFAVSSGPTP